MSCGSKIESRPFDAAQDRLQAAALRRAGIGSVEVVGGEMSSAELRRVIERLVREGQFSR